MRARYQSIYIPAEMLAEMEAEAKRLDRSLRWLTREALAIALPTLRTAPSFRSQQTQRAQCNPAARRGRDAT